MAFNKIARMRTAKQCAEHFKAEDKDSSISEYYIRMLIKTKKIPVFKTGVKYLINLDKLIDYFNTELEEVNDPVQNYGKIRRVGD